MVASALGRRLSERRRFISAEAGQLCIHIVIYGFHHRFERGHGDGGVLQRRPRSVMRLRLGDILEGMSVRWHEFLAELRPISGKVGSGILARWVSVARVRRADSVTDIFLRSVLSLRSDCRFHGDRGNSATALAWRRGRCVWGDIPVTSFFRILLIQAPAERASTLSLLAHFL
jgi:hypothetical protein